MFNSNPPRAFGSALILAWLAMTPAQPAAACSRAVYFGLKGQTVTGRSMDWVEDMHTNLWIFPRGMQRDGGMSEKGYKWTSKYGSVIASVYEAGTADGMNEKGLVANLLFLVESEYPGGQGDNRPQMPISAWTQYILDNFDTFSPSLVWVRLNQVDFREGSGVRKLTLHGNPDLAGDQTANFKATQPFQFLAPH